eukprot:797536-Pleurochrysis_carterae.AAC.2
MWYSPLHIFEPPSEYWPFHEHSRRIAPENESRQRGFALASGFAGNGLQRSLARNLQLLPGSYAPGHSARQVNCEEPENFDGNTLTKLLGLELSLPGNSTNLESNTYVIMKTGSCRKRQPPGPATALGEGETLTPRRCRRDSWLPRTTWGMSG